jgi:hypothetical protein|nr:MAG TPA: hypothetical protein [Caudoviricetes sp.]
MSFNSKVMIFDAVVFIIGVIIISILNLSIKRDNKKYNKDLVESNIKKSCEIRKLNREIDRLNTIIKNNEYDTKLDYDKIYYHSAIGRIVLSDGKIVAKEQYTTDITKAKNFGKYKNDYVELDKEDN